MQKSNGNSNLNKPIFNLNAIINNLKISLEKFDSSIRELKANMNKDKEEKNRKIKELEDTFNTKLNSLTNNPKSNDNGITIDTRTINEIISKINYLEQKYEQIESDIKNKISQNKVINDYNIENEYSSKT